MNSLNSTTYQLTIYPFLSGGGEMGELMRTKDWSQTSLGTPGNWPTELRTTIQILLTCKFPMFLWWGPELLCFYNDAYRPSLGQNGKHPGILGKPANEAWPEIWHIIKPLIDQVLAGGEATWSEDQLIPIFRNGRMEDVYWSFSYSPVNDESGKVTGVLVTCNETTDKVITRRTLQENKDQLQFAIDAADLATWDLDPVTNKFTGNDRLKEWHCLGSLDVFDLEKGLSVVAEKDRESLKNAINKSLDFSSGGILDIEYTIIHPVTKQSRIVKAKGKATFGKDKIAYRLNGILQDVTQQVISRRQMEESEERFRKIVRQAPLGITILHGPEFIVEMANENYLEIVDKTESEFVSKPLFESLPDARKEVEQLLSNVLLTGIPYYGYEFPVTIKRHDKKETAYFNFVYHPIKESNGSFSGIIAVATDVTPTVKAKHLIADSERQFRHMVIQSPIPMTILRGKEYLVETANKAMFEDIWRKTEEEIIGKPLLAIFPELKEQKYAELLNEVYTTGKRYNEKEAEAYLRTENGMRTLYLDYEYAPLIETDNTISGIIVTISDVTEKVEARKIIEQSEQRSRSLIESAPFPIGVYIGREMRIQMLNEAIVTVWGKGTIKDIIGKKYAEVLPELKGQGIYEQLDSVYTTGIPFHAHNQRVDLLINDTMIPHYFNYSFTPLFDSEGKVYGVMNTAAEVTDLVLTKEKIEESEKRFRNVANSAPVFIWMSGTDGLRNFFNTAWLNFTGRTMEQETGNGWVGGVHPDDLEKCMDLYFTSFENKEEYYMEYRLRRHDGEYRWISARGVPRFTSNNAFEGYIGACMDIHEQVIAQKKLKEDEERLNIIVAASDLGTWELNLKTMEVICSDRYIQMFGYDKAVRLSHKELLKHLHQDDLPKRTAALKAAVTSGVLHYESRIIWKDKSVHWVENKGKVFYDEENNPQKIIGTTRDTTDEKNYAQQLLDREQKFRLLADSMPQFVWTGDAEGNLNYFSKAVEDYSGLTTAQLQKEGWLQIVHPDDREENIRAWKHAVTTGTDFILEHRFGRADGEYRWQLSRAIPQKDAAGNIQMWVGTSTDIQDMKEQEQQKDYFISMASHELKTPITSIKGYVQILQSTYQKSEDPFLKSSLKIIDKQIVTLTNLISDLLDLSKIKSGNLYLNKENFEITAMIQEVINEITHINPDYSIGFSQSTPAAVHADRGRIAQVLINLLTNAVKYSPHSRKVMIENYIEGNLLTVAVEDTGIGISKNDQEKIFERFYRVEGKNEKTYPGFGIGLFISAEIINRHNGTIGVSSEPGKGSKFYFSIPLIT